MKIDEATPAGYLSKSGAAAYSSLCEGTLDNARRNGELPFIRFSARKILFRRCDLDAWLARKLVDVGQTDGEG